MSGTPELWYRPAPNGRKGTSRLEELGLGFKVHPVNIRRCDQLMPDFLKINPDNRIPVLRDPQIPSGPLPLAESAGDPALSGREDASLPPSGGGPLAGHPVADAPEGRRRAGESRCTVASHIHGSNIFIDGGQTREI